MFSVSQNNDTKNMVSNPITSLFMAFKVYIILNNCSIYKLKVSHY